MTAPPMDLAALLAEAALREMSVAAVPGWLLPRQLPLRPLVVTAHPSEPPLPPAAKAAAPDEGEGILGGVGDSETKGGGAGERLPPPLSSLNSSTASDRSGK